MFYLCIYHPIQHVRIHKSCVFNFHVFLSSYYSLMYVSLLLSIRILIRCVSTRVQDHDCCPEVCRSHKYSQTCNLTQNTCSLFVLYVCTPKLLM